MHMRVFRGLAPTLVAVAGTVGLALTASMTTLVQLAATALIMGGTGMKALGDPHQWGAGTYLDQVNGTYLSDRHLDEDDLYWVSTPEHFWPATGLSDVSFDTSVARGVLSLNNAVLSTPGEKIVVGYSQSANIATREKRNLAELRTQGATVPAADELSFVFVANPNRPNGGILARFEGLYIPLLGVSFDGATPDDEYQTIDVAREYDLIADFPKYPLNLLADLNALMGYFYLHPNYGSSVINLNDPTSYQSYTSGNTTYYLVHTEHLPLLQPLRGTGILDPLLDLAEPTLRVLIDLAYDRTPENMGVPTRAGLIPHIDLDKLASDLAAAAEEGVRDALAGLGVHTADGFDHRTETATALGKPAAAKTTTGIAAAEEPQSEPTRREATSTDAATIDGTVAGADTVKSDPEVDTEVKAKTRPKPQAPAERIRQSLRHTFSPTTSNGVNDDRSGADRRAPLRSPRSDESGSARTKSATATTKNTGPHDKPRRSPRAARSDAA